MLALFARQQFERTVRAYSADLYRFAYWLARDRFVAEDLVQETYLRAWNAWDQLQDDTAVKAWLMTILRREHARLYARKALDTTDDSPEALQIPADVSSIDQYELQQWIEHLPLSLREPLLLQALGGFSCAEIAAILETTDGAVMTRLTRARQALRELAQPVPRVRRA